MRTRRATKNTLRSLRESDGREALCFDLKRVSTKEMAGTPEELAAEDKPEEFGVEQENGGRDDPGDDRNQARVGELAHFRAVGRELDKRDHREGQLKAQNHLAENKQRSDFVIASNANHHCCRNNRDRASNEAAQPRLEANVEEAFHNNLTRERAGERGVLAGGEQSASKKRAGETGSQDGTEELVSVGDFGDVVQATRVKCRGAKDENRSVNKKGKAERHRRVKNRIVHGFAPVSRGDPKSAGL